MFNKKDNNDYEWLKDEIGNLAYTCEVHLNGALRNGTINQKQYDTWKKQISDLSSTISRETFENLAYNWIPMLRGLDFFDPNFPNRS